MIDVSSYMDIVTVIHMDGNVIEHYDNENPTYDFTDMGDALCDGAGGL